MPDMAYSSSVIERTWFIVVLKHIKKKSMSHTIPLGDIVLHYKWTWAW